MSGCIHRGKRNDESTQLGYASVNGYCYLLDPPVPINVKHQESHCLCAEHAGCPLLKYEVTQDEYDEIVRTPNKSEGPLVSTDWVFQWAAVFTLLILIGLVAIYL